MRPSTRPVARLLLVLLALALPITAPAAEVTGFSPQGTVKRIRQVTARFSEAMVPLGDPRGAPDPFEASCPEPGTGRWVDSRNWVYDFARDLPAGIECTFRVRPGLQSLTGVAVGGRQTFAFSTGGPAILASHPRQGDLGIDEEQAFVLVLDAEPTETSLLAHVGFAVEGVTERVGVRFVGGPDREAILRARFPGRRPAPLVVVQARQRFPNGARVSLVWGKGVATGSGVVTEQDQALPFVVRPAFTARFTCERENPRKGCVPVAAMAVEFSAPVAAAEARRVALVGADGRRWTSKAGTASATAFRLDFTPPFPEAAVFRVEVPADLTDDAGRPLANAAAFPLTVRTEAFPPLAKFAARFGIIEWKADPTLPVTVRNLEPDLQARLLRVDQAPGGGGTGLLGWVKGAILRIPPEHSAEILPWLRKVAVARRETSVFGPPDPGRPLRIVSLSRPEGAQPFEVVGIPLGAPGLYVVELESPRLGAALLGKPKPMYVPTAALVTNLAVHLKWGREGSVVWVTALDSGRPVAGARVSVYDCRGTASGKGQTDGQGIARLAALPTARALPRCPRPQFPRPFFDWAQVTTLMGLDEGLFVVAQTHEDLGLVHSSWDRGIEPWRFQLPAESFRGPAIGHTVFDRALFRAGETVHMKHLIRLRTLQGFVPVPDAERPRHATVRHLGSRERYELPLQWDARGVATSTWAIPQEAKLGQYQVVLMRPERPAGFRLRPSEDGEDGEASEAEWERELPSGAFRVEEFRVPLMRGLLRAPAEPLVAVSEFPLDLSLQYLAGGGAALHPVTLRAQVRPRAMAAGEEFEGFAFANGSVREGMVRRGARDLEEEDEEDAAAPPGGRPAVHQRESLTLDAVGTGRVTIRGLPRAATPTEVLAELEFRDPSGEAQTVATTVPLWPARWLVGIKPDGWVASRDRLQATIAVVDVAGRPVAGAPARVDILEQRAYSHRKRLVGGFYAYDHVQEIRRVGELCRGVTDARGRVACEAPAPVDGNVVLQASVTDPDGRATTAHASVWVARSAEWWFEAQDHDRIDLLPERRRYEPGETARFQVRMPFREATALVTLEREGVRDAFVVRLTGREPVIELPVRERDAPNMYVSVLAVRGRVGDVQPTALVDLGRPAFKLGVAEISVGWRAHELRVSVAADRPTYRVRETARVRIAARTPDGGPPPAGSEVAVAAVDEGVLDLWPNPSWSLLEAMMGRRGYGVRTATAQLEVVGKRHYGRKALAQGGGGGRQSTRDLFDTLLAWQARVPLDARGEAVVDVPLNDSLTSFRIVAVATSGVDRFGTGATTIRTTQDLMLLPGLAPLVREGDRFRAEVTLRNATERPMEATVQGRVEGLPAPLAPQTVTLAAGQARAVGWELTAPVGVGTLRYEIEAGERGGPTDRVRVGQRVVPVVPVRTYQATLSQWAGPLHQPVERPADAVPGRGGIQVAFRPTLIEGLAGVREWMRRYPYTCLEQQVSRAVALRDDARWRAIVAALPASMDEDGLLKYFPTMLWGSDVLTAYVLALSHEAGWPIPDELRGRMQDALRRFVEGRLYRGSGLPTTDLSIRKLAALEALSRYGVAEPRLLGSITLEPTLWPTSAVLDWRSLLHRVPGIPDRERRLREAAAILGARLTFSGTTMGFATEPADALWWLMVSADVNAVRLVLHLLDTGEWRDDLPRLVRGALQRQKGGAWDLTVANAWGVLAVERFSDAFERVPVGGTSRADLGGTSRQLEWAQAPKGAALDFPWPAGPADLVVEHAGSGRPWVTVLAQAAIPLGAPLEAGYRIDKRLVPLTPREGGGFRRGDLVRVRLTIEAQTDMTWVVVHDPIPAGASHLGTGLGRDSQLATQGEAWRGRAWPAFEERGFEAFRAYYAWVPKGTFVVEYTLRLNQSGRFALPTTRVDALYAPELFGERPNGPVEIEE